MLPYWPNVPGAPQNSIIGGGSLWVLQGRPEAEYKGVARFFAFLSRPGRAGGLASMDRLSAVNQGRL